MILRRRYPGVRPFESAEKNLFFGRERDIRDLSILVALEKLVVLFGRSGYGKSSIINAGLIPTLTEQVEGDEALFIPILVRLGSYVPEASLSPVDHLMSRLNEIVPEPPNHFFLDTALPEKSLWYHFKKRQQASHQCFLLIFDQFEEFFTYPQHEQEDFNHQLQEVLYTDMPQSVRERLATFDRTQRQLLADPTEVKVLIAIRSDRLNLLHSMGNIFPAILDKRSRYELNGLSWSQAEEAIQNPAKQKGKFDSPIFSYSDEALHTVLNKLSESKYHRNNAEIETFQLQIICEYLEDEIIKRNIPGNRIEAEHFADKIDQIYEGYYQRLLNRLPPNLEPAAQQLIEESLIFEDENTGEARRLSVDADVLVQRYYQMGVTHDTLRALENTFLLRREANSVGSFSYEVSHDTLLGAILNQKRFRKLEEENQRRVMEGKERRKKENRQRIRLAGSTGLAILGFALAALAWQKSMEAEHQRYLAEAARNEAQAAQKTAEEALSRYEQEQKRSRSIELVNTGDNYFNLGKYEEALENYQKAQAETPENQTIREKIEKCLLKIRNR